MIITIPDPYPGRCLNMRQGNRCLDNDRHGGSCIFDENDPYRDLWWQAETRQWTLAVEEPEPWVVPWERGSLGEAQHDME